MKIDRRLNLVIPIERTDGTVLFAHSAPIATETFTAFYRPIALTYAQLVEDGLVRAGGARVADLLLKEISERLGLWADDPQTKKIGVERGLMAEIRRLTNVFAPTDKGWQMVPLEETINSGMLSKDEKREVEAAACFFTCASQMFPKQNLQDLVDMALRFIGAATSYSSITEFQNSLPTLTAGENFGAKAAVWWETFSKPAPQESASVKS